MKFFKLALSLSILTKDSAFAAQVSPLIFLIFGYETNSIGFPHIHTTFISQQQSLRKLVAGGDSGLCDAISVDGNTDDWDLTAKHINMHRQGDPETDVEAKAFHKTCCAEDNKSSTICILVLAEEGNTIVPDNENTWFIDYGKGFYPETPLSRQYIVANEKTVGWEACYPSTDIDGLEAIEIHSLYNGDGSNGNSVSTSRTTPVSLAFSCDVMEPTVSK